MQTIISALTYDGSVFDTVLNAVVLVIVLAALLAQGRSPWWVVAIVVVVLQVVLWFALDVVGFSLVWSGLAGAAIVEFIAARRAKRRWSALAVGVVASLAAILYYAVALPPITTIAHLLALLVGVGLTALARRVRRSRVGDR